MAAKKSAKTAKKSRGWVVRIVLIAFALYIFIKAVQLYSQLEQKQLAYAELDNKIQTQMVINEGLADQVEHAEDYLEHKANGNGYYVPGQQVYQNEAG